MVLNVHYNTCTGVFDLQFGKRKTQFYLK